MYVHGKKALVRLDLWFPGVYIKESQYRHRFMIPRIKKTVPDITGP
jgi:hypothetical protein